MESWLSWVIFAVLIGFLLWTLTRRRGRGTPRLQTAIAVISDVNENLKVLETRQANPQSTKKFKTGAWKAYQDKLDFLDPATVASLKESSTLIEEFNQRIESARKTRSMATLQDMPLDKLKEPLSKSKEGLVQWLKANLQEEMKPTRRGCLGI